MHGRRFFEIKINFENLHRTNESSNFLGDSFSHVDNVRVSLKFRKERLKRWFLLKSKPIHFHINSTRLIRPVKRKKLSFSCLEMIKPVPAKVQCFVGQIQVQKSILFVATDQMPGHNQVETSIMSIDSSSTNVIIRILEEVY